MVTFRVPDMTCGYCASTISRAVAGLDKDADIEVSIPQKLVTVVSTAPEGDLAKAIQQAGYSPEKVAAAPSLPARSAGSCCCSGAKSASAQKPLLDAPRRG